MTPTQRLKGAVLNCLQKIGKTARSMNLPLDCDLNEVYASICDEIDSGAFSEKGLKYPILNAEDVDDFKIKLLEILEEFVELALDISKKLPVDVRSLTHRIADSIKTKELPEAVDAFGLPIQEDLSKWDTGRWVHYSNHPEVKINPQQFHQDPAGIYLFPESFKPEGSWFKMPYKFLVQSKAQNVLDLSTLSVDSAISLLSKMVPESVLSSYEDEIRASRWPIDTWWEMMKNYFIHTKGRATAEWSKAIRNLGYDAIFDDTGSIMGNEVQLVVLDPLKVKVLERIDQKATGFEEVTEVSKKLAEMLREYGEVSIVGPKKQKPTWSSGAKDLESKVEVQNGDKRLAWSVATRFHDEKDAVPSEISVRLTGGAYELRQQMSQGVALRWDRQPWDFSELQKLVQKVGAHEFGSLTKENMDYWGLAGAGGLFYAEDTGRYLFAHRSPHVNEPNTWGTWGGKIDRNESPVNALKREAREESGYDGPMQIQHVSTYRDGNFSFDNYLMIVPHEFEPRHSWETQGHVWTALSALPSPLHYGAKEMVKHLLASTKTKELPEAVDAFGLPVVTEEAKKIRAWRTVDDVLLSDADPYYHGDGVLGPGTYLRPHISGVDKAWSWRDKETDHEGVFDAAKEWYVVTEYEFSFKNLAHINDGNTDQLWSDEFIGKTNNPIFKGKFSSFELSSAAKKKSFDGVLVTGSDVDGGEQVLIPLGKKPPVKVIGHHLVVRSRQLADLISGKAGVYKKIKGGHLFIVSLGQVGAIDRILARKGNL